MKDELAQGRLNQVLLDNMPCVALLLRPATREIVASNLTAIKVGASPGLKCFSAWRQRQTPCPWCLAPTLWETSEPQRLEVGANGVIWDAHWIPIGPDLYLHYAFDITDLKQTELTLKEREESNRKRHAELQAVLDLVPAYIVFAHDPDCRYMTGNIETYKLLGLPPGSNISLSAPVAERPGTFQVMKNGREIPIQELPTQKAAATGESVRDYEFDLVYADGAARHQLCNAVPLLDKDGLSRGAVAAIVDITDRKRLEEEHLRFSKLESLGTMAGGIAHDFNNILTAILGNIGLAMVDDQIRPQVQERLVQAEQACLRAQTLSQQLLTFAKGGAPIKKIIPISKLLKNTVGLTLSGSKSRCELSIPEDLWPVEVDERQVNQVFNNLLLNADQAMPEGGVISIVAENILGETEADLPNPAGKYVKFIFSDQGTGISPKYINRIFDPYFSTKEKGSGLGLATVYSIIKNHCGLIKVKSQVEVGTIFTLYLPAIETGAFAANQGTPISTGDQVRVLVMDDEEMVRQVLGRILAHLGYQAELASDGSEAIEKFVKAQAEGRPFATVILDLTVPGGMGGKDAIKELLKIDPQVKAIVSSGYSDDPIMAGFQEYGFRGVVAKPYRMPELSKILHEIIK
ncbi:MAG: ATP-binding protein [Desulfobaccales bacterium]